MGVWWAFGVGGDFGVLGLGVWDGCGGYWLGSWVCGFGGFRGFGV